jgi:hypothetical protein
MTQSGYSGVMEAPNFEQRLNAIRDTLELVAGMQLASEERRDAIDGRIEKLLQTLERDGEHINALARIADHSSGDV